LNDKTPDCSAKSQSCWDTPDVRGRDYLYFPNDITYDGVVYKSGSCCYAYTSVKNNYETLCNGKKSDQSHITMEVDCPASDFSLDLAQSTTGNEGKPSYGNDGSTCYTGIKINDGCSGACSYEVCVKYSGLGAGNCPTKDGWIMDKAGNAFAFGKLPIPSCNNGVAMAEDTTLFSYIGVNGTVSDFLYANQMILVSMLSVLMFAICWYFGCLFGGDKDEEYEAVNEQTEDFKRYSTFE